MIDLEKINRVRRGWGLHFSDAEIEEILEHLLWDCASINEFYQKCEFIFNSASVALVWKKEERSATIWLGEGRSITASVLSSSA
ncbi:hypothetical protein KKC00_02765 [Patescibacteria group bacterium]|nr:hypothetical protein [Patescibacteria group bacterium]